MSDEWEAISQQGRQLVREKKFPQAIELFEKALSLNPDHTETHDAIAIAHFALKQYDNAIEHFQRLAQLRPTDAKPLINWGAVHNRKGEFQKGADVLKKAVQKNGKSAEAYYNLGIAYHGLKQLPMAVNAYKEALRILPDFIDAMQNLGNTYLEMNNTKAAIEQFQKALSLQPDFERARQSLAKAEEQKQQAKADFNPFGRLVTQAPTKQTQAVATVKELSPEDRLSDRQAIRRFMLESQSAARLLVELLQSSLLTNLAALNRGVQMSQKTVHKSVYASNDELETIFQSLQQHARSLNEVTKQLKAHEDSLKP